MIQIILYNNWMLEAEKKIVVKGKRVPQISKTNIREILKLCTKACKVEEMTMGTLYQIK